MSKDYDAPDPFTDGDKWELPEVKPCPTPTRDEETMMIRNAWEFACGWYMPAEVEAAIKRKVAIVPKDVDSPEFAAWLTDQYRLAMAKGIDCANQAASCVHPDAM